MTAPKSQEVMEEILNQRPQAEKRLRKRFSQYLIGILFFALACTSEEEASQVYFMSSPEVDSLFKYYDQDQLDNIVITYERFLSKAYSLDSLADTVQLRVWAAFGYGLNKTGNHQEALQVYQKALGMASQIYGVNHTKYGSIANNIAIISKRLERYHEAIYYYGQALNVDQSDTKKGNKYNNLGELYRAIQKYDSALICLDQANKLLPEASQYYPENNKGQVYIDLEDWESARLYLNNAIQLSKKYFTEDEGRSYLIASTYNRLAITYISNNDYEQALKFLESAQAVEHNHYRTRLDTYLFQAQSLYQLKEYPKALSLIRDADQLLMQKQSTLLSQSDKLFFVGQMKEFSNLGFRLGLAMDDLATAFYFSERGKATVLQELYASSGTELPSFKPITIPSLQKRLGENVALIEYKFTADSLHAFVISREEAQLLTIASSQADSLAQVFRRSIMGGLIKEFAQIAPQTFEEIFAPLERAIAGKDKLIIIPDQSLSYIPWEALLREEPQDKETWKDDYFAKLPFLVKDYAISYHFAASLAFDSRSKTPAYNQELVGFAPSEFATREERSFKPLKYAQAFAKEIPRSWPSSKFYTYQATKLRFKEFLKTQSKVRCLHLDTHGVANESNPDSSALVFQDSLLYLSEILELNASSYDLITLATCSSGEGTYVPGEGIISLARGFVSIGARNIIHSLWLANDEATASLFRHFYKFIKEGKSYSEALKMAKLQIIQEPGGHPSLWANFILFEQVTSP